MTWDEVVKEIKKKQTGMSNRTTEEYRRSRSLKCCLWHADHLEQTGFCQARSVFVELVTCQEATVFIPTNLLMSVALIIVTAHNLITWYVNVMK